MQIDILQLGSYETNSHILRKSPEDTECLIIDTGLEPQPLVDFLKEHKLNPVAVILTHGHADHIFGISALKELWPNVKVCVHSLDANMLAEPKRNLSLLAGVVFKADPADYLIQDEEPLSFAGIDLEVRHTPGHTPGSISLYCRKENIIFTGDAIFAGSVGRTDFPGGDHKQLIDSIKTKIITLPDDTKVYPGHGPETTIGREKTTNPFLR